MKVGYRVLFRDGAKLRQRLFLEREHKDPLDAARSFCFKQKMYGNDYRLERVSTQTIWDSFREGYLIPLPALFPKLRIPLIYVVAAGFVCYATYYLVRH